MTHEILIEARAELVARGFWQNVVEGRRDSQWCATGTCAWFAIQDTRPDDVDELPALVALGNAMGIDVDGHAQHVGKRIAEWNDSHSRAEVLAAYDAAIEASA